MQGQVRAANERGLTMLGWVGLSIERRVVRAQTARTVFWLVAGDWLARKVMRCRIKGSASLRGVRRSARETGSREDLNNLSKLFADRLCHNTLLGTLHEPRGRHQGGLGKMHKIYRCTGLKYCSAQGAKLPAPTPFCGYSANLPVSTNNDIPIC